MKRDLILVGALWLALTAVGELLAVFVDIYPVARRPGGRRLGLQLDRLPAPLHDWLVAAGLGEWERGPGNRAALLCGSVLELGGDLTPGWIVNTS